MTDRHMQDVGPGSRTYFIYLNITSPGKKNLSIWFICVQCVVMIVVRLFAHGTMGRRIDPSWRTHSSISRSSQCHTTGVTKAVICDILSVG